MGLTKTRDVVEKNDSSVCEDEHGAGEDEVVGESVDNGEEDERKESFEEERFADLVEMFSLLDDGVSAFADGFERFIQGKEHNDGEFVGVVTAQEAKEEGKNEHGGAAPETGMEII